MLGSVVVTGGLRRLINTSHLDLHVLVNNAQDVQQLARVEVVLH